MFEKKISDVEKKKMNKEAKREAKAAKRGNKGSIGEKILSILKVVVLPALFAGIVSMVIYMAMQNKAAEAQLKTQVVVMTKDVAANTFVSEEKINDYFKEISVDFTAVPKAAYKNLKDLPKTGFYVDEAMYESQMVLKGDVVKESERMAKYTNGYDVTSFAAESFDGGVNGSLRHGDIVSVYAIDPATEMLTLMAENVYVLDVYDNSGNKVTEPDGIATSFTVYVTPEEVENINLAVVYGGIQMYLMVE